MIPHEITVRADLLSDVKSGRRYNFKFQEGREVRVFSAKVRDLKCRDEGYRRLRFAGVRMSIAS